MIEVFNELGNPFTEASDNLFALDTKLIMSDNVIDNITTAEATGTEQYETFVESHLLKMPFNDNIKKNNLQLFKSGERKHSSAAKSKNKVKYIKSDLQLFQECISLVKHEMVI